MKFIVRKDFVCPITTVTKGRDGQPDTVITNTYIGGQEIDIDAETAALHLHKLEAVDKKAVELASDAVLQPTK